MGTTTIEWTDRTWNPVTGCMKVSAGCKNCYAEGVADRFFAKQYPPIAFQNAESRLAYRPRKFTDVLAHDDRLDQPLRWRKPARIFVNSMSDLFHEDVSDDFLNRAFSNVMEMAERHTFQILTKRPERMLKYLSWRWGEGRIPMRNIWIGVSVEDQETADERIPILLSTPAAVRFISYEPALGPVDLIDWMVPARPDLGSMGGGSRQETMLQDQWTRRYGSQVGLNWVIVGGESGRGARPFNIQWARRVVRQCRATGVPMFVKQMGSLPIVAAGCQNHFEWGEGNFADYDNDTWRITLKDRKGGDINEWPEDLRVREFPV